MTDVREVLNERGKVYGSFADEASLVQALKGIMRVGTKWDTMEADKQLALELICLKAGRILTGDSSHIDNWVDIAGYATLVADELKKGENIPNVAVEEAEKPLYMRDTINEARRSIPSAEGPSSRGDGERKR